MEVTHFLALAALCCFLIMSLVFYSKLLVHLLLISYAIALGWFAIINVWEVMFFPVICLSVIIGLILFTYAAMKGNWL